MLIQDKKKARTPNIFGYIAYSDRNPYIIKLLEDDAFWRSLNARTEGWILYAIKPNSPYYQGGNAEYINYCLGLKPEDYPQLVMLAIGSDGTMMQRNYPISEESVDDAYKSLKDNIDAVCVAVRRIHPNYLSSTNVHREVVKALDAELASKRWKRVVRDFVPLAKALFFKEL